MEHIRAMAKQRFTNNPAINACWEADAWVNPDESWLLVRNAASRGIKDQARQRLPDKPLG